VDLVEQEIHEQGEGEAMVGEALSSDMGLGIKAGTVTPDKGRHPDVLETTLRARLASI
jgi:hypothetical protein